MRILVNFNKILWKFIQILHGISTHNFFWWILHDFISEWYIFCTPPYCRSYFTNQKWKFDLITHFFKNNKITETRLLWMNCTSSSVFICFYIQLADLPRRCPEITEYKIFYIWRFEFRNNNFIYLFIYRLSTDLCLTDNLTLILNFIDVPG
jgi:hypothetical protein